MGILFISFSEADSIEEVAEAEIQKRQQVKAASSNLIQAGLAALSDGRHGEAMNKFRSAFDSLPNIPVYAERRKTLYKHYQAATLQFAEDSIAAAEWVAARDALKTAIETGKTTGFTSSLDPALHRKLSHLNDPEYYPSTTVTPTHLNNVENVKRNLIAAQGAVDHGKYDQAIELYNQVLAIDRTNTAARRGMENVERHRIRYYEVSRDHTRAKFLRKVAEAWECEVPLTAGAARFSLPVDNEIKKKATIDNKLDRIVIPTIELEQVPLVNAIELLRRKSVELDTSDDIANRGINFVLDTSSFSAGDNPGLRPITLRLSNVTLRQLLGDLCRLSQTAFRVEGFAVSIVSKDNTDPGSLQIQQWIVPPGFLNQGSQSGGSTITDPFASPSTSSSRLNLVRKTAQQFLEESGITFGPGTLAFYDRNSKLLRVRNTTEQLALVDNLVQISRKGVNQMVMIKVKIISMLQEDAEERGIDWLLGAASLGSNLAFGGGTDGNSINPLINTNDAVSPFNTTGLAPITSGLRSANLLAENDSVEAILTNGTPATATDVPGVFSVAGTLTDPQFQGIIRAFRQSRGVDFLCETGLLVQPGQRGKIEIIREFPYPTEYDPPEVPNNVFSASASSSGVITPATPAAFEVKNLGKTVEVSPTVGADNQTVSVDVSVDFSEFVGFINYGSNITLSNTTDITGASTANQIENNILLPVFDVVRETTSVSVYDGHTIAIGGLFGHRVTDVQDKIPFVGDAPVLGPLARSASESHAKTALMIFLSVSIVDPGGQPINSFNKDAEQPNVVRPYNPQTPQTPNYGNPLGGSLPK